MSLHTDLLDLADKSSATVEPGNIGKVLAGLVAALEAKGFDVAGLLDGSDAAPADQPINAEPADGEWPAPPGPPPSA